MNSSLSVIIQILILYKKSYIIIKDEEKPNKKKAQKPLKDRQHL